MRFSLFLFFFAAVTTSLFSATNLLTYNLFQRSGYIDLMLSFDQPFDGAISQQKGKNYTAVTLDNIAFAGSVKKTFADGDIDGLSIYADNSATYVVIASAQDVFVTASKTTNGYGIRFRFKSAAPVAKTTAPSAAQSVLGKLPTLTDSDEPNAQDEAGRPLQENLKGETISTLQLFYVAMVLILLLLVLWYVKNRFNGKSNSWLFSGSGRYDPDSDIRVVSQKQLDVKNRIIALEANGFRYLIIVGASGSYAIDKTPISTATEHKEEGSVIRRPEGFDALLQENHQRLNRFLETDNRQLEAYKQKASG